MTQPLKESHFRWTDPDFIVVSQPASTSCVKITPDVSPSYTTDDPLPVQRSMVSCVLLPDGKVLCLNGARMGMFSRILMAKFHFSAYVYRRGS